MTDLKRCPLCSEEAEPNTEWEGGALVPAEPRGDLPGVEWTRPGCLSCRFSARHEHWQSLPRVSNMVQGVAQALVARARSSEALPNMDAWLIDLASRLEGAGELAAERPCSQIREWRVGYPGSQNHLSIKSSNKMLDGDWYRDSGEQVQADVGPQTYRCECGLRVRGLLSGTTIGHHCSKAHKYVDCTISEVTDAPSSVICQMEIESSRLVSLGEYGRAQQLDNWLSRMRAVDADTLPDMEDAGALGWKVGDSAVLNKGVDHDSGAVSMTIAGPTSPQEPMCVHGRPSGGMCPHCMGLNETPVDGGADKRWERVEAYFCEAGNEAMVYRHPYNQEWCWEWMGDIPRDGAGFDSMKEAAAAAEKEIWED